MIDRQMRDLAEQWRLDALRHQRLAGRRHPEPLVPAALPGGEENTLPPTAGQTPDYDAEAHNSSSLPDAGRSNPPAGGLIRPIAVALLLFTTLYLAIWLVLWFAGVLE